MWATGAQDSHTHNNMNESLLAAKRSTSPGAGIMPISLGKVVYLSPVGQKLSTYNLSQTQGTVPKTTLSSGGVLEQWFFRQGFSV